MRLAAAKQRQQQEVQPPADFPMANFLRQQNPQAAAAVDTGTDATTTIVDPNIVQGAFDAAKQPAIQEPRALAQRQTPVNYIDPQMQTPIESVDAEQLYQSTPQTAQDTQAQLAQTLQAPQGAAGSPQANFLAANARGDNTTEQMLQAHQMQQHQLML